MTQIITIFPTKLYFIHLWLLLSCQMTKQHFCAVFVADSVSYLSPEISQHCQFPVRVAGKANHIGVIRKFLWFRSKQVKSLYVLNSICAICILLMLYRDIETFVKGYLTTPALVVYIRMIIYFILIIKL